MVQTSLGKVQAGYFLKEPTSDLDRVEHLNQRLGVAVGGDNVWNRGRILRLPGFINMDHPGEQRAHLLEFHPDLRYSLDDLEVTGQDFRLSSEVGIPSVSLDGTLVYGPGPTAGTLRQLVWVSRTGEVLERIGQPQDNMNTLALSPDETRVAVAASEQGTQPKIWIHGIERGNKRVITFGDARDLFPFWNTDGDLVGYSSGNTTIRSVPCQ